MARMDWSKVEAGDYVPGVYLCEIRKAEEKESKATGMQYMNLEWHEVGDRLGGGPTLVGWDILMMAGKGRSLSQAKLKVLGFDGTEGEILPEDLVGRRAWVTWEWQEFNGERRLKVASAFRPVFTCGYAHKDQAPSGASGSIAIGDDLDVPF